MNNGTFATLFCKQKAEEEHFVLVYEVDSQWGKVYILRVLHTAQKWP